MKWLLGLLILVPYIGFSQNTIKVVKPDDPVMDTLPKAKSYWLTYAFHYGQYNSDFSTFNTAFNTNFMSPIGLYGITIGDLPINIGAKKILTNFMYSGIFPHRKNVNDTIGFRYKGNLTLLNFGGRALSVMDRIYFYFYGGFGVGNEKLRHFYGNEKYRYFNRAFVLNTMSELRIMFHLSNNTETYYGFKFAAALGHWLDASSGKWKTNGDGDLLIPNSKLNGFYGLASLGFVAYF